MAVRVYGPVFPGGARNFEAYRWEIDDGYLHLLLENGDCLVTMRPDQWRYVEDLDPVISK